MEEDHSGTSDWDHDNDGILDEDDKIPTRINMTSSNVLWLDAVNPAIFKGTVNWLDPDTGVFEPAPDLPVQITIEWARNGTLALETVDVLTDAAGAFVVGQFLLPEDLIVGPNTTYNIYAEVTEMFYHDGSQTEPIPVEVRANTTIDYVLGHISEAMNNRYSWITRSTMKQIGIVVYSTTELLTRRFLSVFTAARLEIHTPNDFRWIWLWISR